MRLTFTQSPTKVLEIEKPDGSSIALTLKRLTVRKLSEYEDLERKLKTQLENGKLSNMEYTLRSFEHMCENFNREDIMDLESSHVLEILRAIRDLQMNTEEAEKKSPL